MAASKSAAISLAIAMMCFGTSAWSATDKVPPDLSAVLSGSNEAAKDSRATQDIPEIRLRAMTKAALEYGVQSGLARRNYEIVSMLNEQKQMLDEIYNFSAMLLDKNVMPPVLSQSQNSINQSDPDTIRIADATYKIERQAHFITVPATWRDYLTIKDFKFEIDMPADVLLPKTDAEKKLWQKLIADGWKVGIQQADQIFQKSLSLLERDYKGMVLYRSLLAKGMIGRPYVAEANLGITGDGNGMSINDRILRITSKPQLEVNSAVWKPIVVPK